MSVHSELQNVLKNRSGNAALNVRSRSGDSEEGNALFDLMPSAAPSAFEVVTQSEQQEARKQFLARYFTLLKSWLNRFEFEYVKQLYLEGRDEKTVFDMLGLQPKKFKKALTKKLAAHTEEVQELAEASEWEDAELFSRCFLAAPKDIARDAALMQSTPKIKGFGNLIKAKSQRERFLQMESDRKYQRRVYMRGFMRGKRANVAYELIQQFCIVLGDIQASLYLLSPKYREDLTRCFTSKYDGVSPMSAEESENKINDMFAATYELLRQYVSDKVDFFGDMLKSLTPPRSKRMRGWWFADDKESATT